MYERDLALNNPEGLICCRSQPTNQPTELFATKRCSSYHPPQYSLIVTRLFFSKGGFDFK